MLTPEQREKLDELVKEFRETENTPDGSEDDIPFDKPLSEYQTGETIAIIFQRKKGDGDHVDISK